MTLEITVVDAFTSRPFKGNPAAVAFLESFPDDARMQAIAREMNQSDTAFAARRDDGDYDLRWFTPTTEVDLCGHATLAAAHLLGGVTRFHTRSGLLTCRPATDGWIEMDFPADVPAEATVPNGFTMPGLRWYGLARSDALIELDNASLVRRLEPDLSSLASLGTRGVIVTAGGDRSVIDCVSRFFAPNAGIPEDPVTGSAHCTLAAFWGARLGRETLVGEQASTRGGVVRMRNEGDRVVLGGQAVTVANVRFAV